MSTHAVIGIDPGSTGGAVIINRHRAMQAYSFKNQDMKTIAAKIQLWDLTHANVSAFIEKVGAMPHDRPKNAFAFGFNTGSLYALLEANGIPVEEVFSQVWQRHFKLGRAFPSKKDRKNAQKETAEKLFPCEKITLCTADALLIAEYGWQKTFGG